MLILKNRIYSNESDFFQLVEIKKRMHPMSHLPCQLPHKYLLYKWVEDTHLFWWCYIAQFSSRNPCFELPTEPVYVSERKIVLLFFSLLLFTKKGTFPVSLPTLWFGDKWPLAFFSYELNLTQEDEDAMTKIMHWICYNS